MSFEKLRIILTPSIYKTYIYVFYRPFLSATQLPGKYNPITKPSHRCKRLGRIYYVCAVMANYIK